MQGPVYFSDLKRSIPGINDRILNERLVELVDLGLATRTVVDERPIRVRYQLTEHGAAIRPALAELTRWAQDHLRRPSNPVGERGPDVALVPRASYPQVSTAR
jgi:DNA-binding HxlR family transcriptional regulator